MIFPSSSSNILFYSYVVFKEFLSLVFLFFFFKVCIEFVTTLLLVYALAFGHEAHGILAP